MKRVFPRTVLSCGTGSVALYALALAETKAQAAPLVATAATARRVPAPADTAGPPSTD